MLGCSSVPPYPNDPNIIMPEYTLLTRWAIAKPVPTKYIMAFSSGSIVTGVMGCFFIENGELTKCQLWVPMSLNFLFGLFCIIVSVIYTTQIVVAVTTMIFTILWMRNWHLLWPPPNSHNENQSTGAAETAGAAEPSIPTAQPINPPIKQPINPPESDVGDETVIVMQV